MVLVCKAVKATDRHAAARAQEMPAVSAEAESGFTLPSMSTSAQASLDWQKATHPEESKYVLVY